MVVKENPDRKKKLNEINKVSDYFIDEIKEKELMNQRPSKYITSFDYSDNSLIALSVITSSIYIPSFATVIGAPIGITSASFSLAFAISTVINKKLLKTRRNNEKKTINL